MSAPPLGAAQVKGSGCSTAQRQPDRLCEGEGIELPLRWLAQGLPLRLRSLSSLSSPTSRAGLEPLPPLRSRVSSRCALGGQGHWYPLTRGQLSPDRGPSSVETGDSARWRSSRAAAALAPDQRHACRLICQGCSSLAAAARLALAGSEVPLSSGQQRPWTQSPFRLDLPSALSLDKEMGAARASPCRSPAGGRAAAAGDRGVTCAKRSRSGSAKPAGLRSCAFSRERPRLGQKRQPISPSITSSRPVLLRTCSASWGLD